MRAGRVRPKGILGWEGASRVTAPQQDLCRLSSTRPSTLSPHCLPLRGFKKIHAEWEYTDLTGLPPCPVRPFLAVTALLPPFCPRSQVALVCHPPPICSFHPAQPIPHTLRTPYCCVLASDLNPGSMKPRGDKHRPANQNSRGCQQLYRGRLAHGLQRKEAGRVSAGRVGERRRHSGCVFKSREKWVRGKVGGG